MSCSGGTDFAEHREALARRMLGQASLVAPQAVEVERPDRQVLAHPRDVELSAEAAHGHLENMRTPRGRERDGLAIQHELCRRERSRGLRDLGDRGGHVIEVAREYAHLIALLVKLDARAIHLPFERELTRQLFECLVHILGGLRQHGSDG